MQLRINSILLSLVVAIVVSAAQAADQVKGTAAGEVMISNPYARAATQTQKSSAVYMSIMNNGKTGHAIVRAKGDVSKVVELHTHIEEGGMSRMRPVDKIELAPGAATELKPGGLHIMLIDLTRNLAEGDKVQLELEFEDGSKATVAAPVRPVMPMGHDNAPMGDQMHNRMHK
jgi:copper(I)-binding protein